MAKQMGVAGDVSYTCETAAFFWLLHVLAPWEKFVASVEQLRTSECVKVGLLHQLRCWAGLRISKALAHKFGTPFRWMVDNLWHLPSGYAHVRAGSYGKNRTAVDCSMTWGCLRIDLADTLPRNLVLCPAVQNFDHVPTYLNLFHTAF